MTVDNNKLVENVDLFTIETSSSSSTTTTTSTRKISSLKLSIIGLCTCFATFIIAFFFKDYFTNVLIYMDEKSDDYFLINSILFTLYLLTSLPFIWGYTLSILISSYVYSFVYGFMQVILFSSISMSFSFFTCRYLLARSKCNQFSNFDINSKYFNAIIQIIEGPGGFKIILLSRLVPLPFGLTNSIFAITKVSYFNFITGSVVGLMPTQLITCYIGSTLKSMRDVVDTDTTNKAYFIFMIQIVIAVFLLFYLLKMSKFVLDRQIDSMNSQVQLFKPNDVDI